MRAQLSSRRGLMLLEMVGCRYCSVMISSRPIRATMRSPYLRAGTHAQDSVHLLALLQVLAR